MALQTTFPHLFNLLPILKPCVTKEKSLAAFVKITDDGLSFYFHFSFYFIFPLFSIFYF